MTVSSSARLVLDVLGERLIVAADDDRTVDKIQPLVADCLAADQERRREDGTGVNVAGGGPWTVLGDDGRTWRPQDGPALVSAVLAAVNLATVGRTRAFAFHAAVVSRGGATLVLPAPSGRGKTTLTAALLLRGWDYVTDEALALTPEEGVILGYPRALALSPWSMAHLGIGGGVQALGETVVRPHDLGARITTKPGQVTHVVLVRRDGRSPRLDSCPRRDGVVELLCRGFNHYKRPQDTLEIVGRIVAGSETFCLDLGEPLDAADMVTSTLLGG